MNFINFIKYRKYCSKAGALLLTFCLLLPLWPARTWGLVAGNPPVAIADDSKSKQRAESSVQPKPIKLLIDGQEVKLTDPIRLINGRSYYPFRSCLESMGALVEWQEHSKTATGILGRQTVVFTLDSPQYVVNGQTLEMQDAVAYVDKDLQRFYIPIRYAAQALGFGLEWQEGRDFNGIALHSPVALAPPTETEAVQLNGRLVRLGDTKERVLENFGKPARVDPSAYGLQWYIYNRNYESFIMIGIAEDQVVGFFTNARNMKLKSGLGQGASKAAIEKAYGKKSTMEFWYDPNNEDKLFAVWCMKEKSSEGQIDANFLKAPEALLRIYEQECFDITNAFRVCHGKAAVVYSEAAAKIALGHAQDMAQRNFFAHENPDGEGPLDRMLKGGMDIQKVTENCAGGYPDAIQVLQGWVESPSHRQGLLEDNDFLGVGAYYAANSKYLYYMVQEFYTPWK